MNLNRVLIVLLACLSFLSGKTQQIDLSYLNPNLSVEERVDNLVIQMTLEEKVSQLMNDSKAIPRLNIPEYNWWNECLHGVARAGNATVFPQSITVASSFDKNLMKRIGDAISDEARAKHHEFLRRGERGIYQGLDFWSPNINIFRDPRWGRGHETYGEDPYLTGEMATQFIKGLQGDNPNYFKVIATSKHFAVHSGPEPSRHTFNAQISDVDLFETYLPAFEKTVKTGGVYSIMGAYNRLRNDPCCASSFLLEDILRKKWGFKGFIVSDCNAITDIYKYHKVVETPEQAAALSVKNGLDLECGGVFQNLGKAVKQGLITEEEINIAVKRVLTARFKLGMFDPADKNPYSQIPYTVVCSAENDQLALEASQKSMVLLKNKNNVLPLNADILKRVAVVGPNANNFMSLLGNYNGVPKKWATAYSGIKSRLEPKVEVSFAQGCTLAEGIHNLVPIPSCYLQTADGRQGLVAEYFDNTNFSGNPVSTEKVDQVNFYWERNAPLKELKPYNYSIRYKGFIVPQVSGLYRIGTWYMSTITLKINGEVILEKSKTAHHARMREKDMMLEAGKKYEIVVEYINNDGDGEVQLCWALPQDKMIDEAVEAATKSDVVIAVVGLSDRLEGEEMKLAAEGFDGGDRTSLNLPREQEELLKKMKQTGKPLIVVVMAGSALSLNWVEENADAIIYAGYCGQQGGNAIADVLFGDYNPAGRLPVTYYTSVDDLPPFDDYSMQGRTYRYFKGKPLYPFGFGLSYTSFEYSNLKVPSKVKAGENVEVSVNVKNSGSRIGDEVVQLYLLDEKGSTPRPICQLEGFERITLSSGESTEIKFVLTREQFSLINKEGKKVIESGTFRIYVGGNQPTHEGENTANKGVGIFSSLKVLGTYSFE